MNNKAPLVNITSVQPLELVCIDFLSLEICKGGFQNVLIVPDHFTRFAQAIATKHQSAKTTAEALYNNYIIHYGIPLKLHSDQGASFNGKIIHELCKLTGMKKSRTSIYHPSGNGMCERFNRTLMNMLGTLKQEQKVDWKKYPGPIVHMYNETWHTSAGMSPFFLMFDRQARLPVDFLFHEHGDDEKRVYQVHSRPASQTEESAPNSSKRCKNITGQARREIRSEGEGSSFARR